MAHELDITEGEASFADSRAAANGQVDAWHKLGQTIGRTMTADEALELSNMKGWDVRKVPLRADLNPARGVDGNGATLRSEADMVEVPGRFLVVRNNPITGKIDPLGVVGSKWGPFQNEETTDLLYDITEQSGAHIETIGALNGGRQTFVSMRMPDHMEWTSPVDGSTDITELYLTILNHHDGLGSLRAIIAPVRVVCANTQRAAEGMAVSSVSLRHTGSPASKLAEVRHVLGITFAYQDTYAAEVQAMVAAERDDEFVRGVLNDVFGVGDAETERARAGRIERASAVMELYRSPGPTTAPWYGTAYGAYNAVTEYLDHYAPVKGKNGDASTKRALRTLTNVGVGSIKSAAFAAFASA